MKTWVILLIVAAAIVVAVLLFRRRAQAALDGGTRNLSASSPPGAVSQLATTEPGTGLPLGLRSAVVSVANQLSALPKIGTGRVADVPQTTPKPPLIDASGNVRTDAAGNPLFAANTLSALTSKIASTINLAPVPPTPSAFIPVGTAAASDYQAASFAPVGASSPTRFGGFLA